MSASGEPLERWERHTGAASAPLGRYRRREPEKTLLHAVVRERLEPFLAAVRQNGNGLPTHVERWLRAYLDCGILARGFARVRCPDCGFERLVAFSCKGHVCPSCATRRMEDAALHLVRDVLPAVPVRQWVLSLPRRLRFQAARSAALTSRLLDVFTRAVFAWQKRAARRTGVADPRTGGVTFVQRFGGALNLNVHFHTLVPDGVFEVGCDDGPARFVRLPAPGVEEVEAILVRVIRRVQKLVPDDQGADLPPEDDAYAALQAGEVDRRLTFPDPFRHGRRAAYLEGFSLHAGVRIHENDRQGLERLCRYAARPPFALHRLSAAPGGRLVYRMKRPRGGSLFLLLTPDQLLAKLATLIPPPRSHALRYHGVFGPSSRVRKKVVPAPAATDPTEPGETNEPESSPWHSLPSVPAPPSPSPPTATAQEHGPPRSQRRPHRTPWAELLQKVFAVDVLACPECGGRLEVLAYISQPSIAKQILDHLGLAAQAPPLARALSHDAGVEAAPEYDCVDPVYEE